MRGALLRAPSQQSMPNKYNPDIHHRRSIRLKDYDYTQAGAYFITICTKDRVNNCRGEVSSPFEVSSPELNAITSIQKGGETPPLHKHALGQFIAFYKYQTTKQINRIRSAPGMSVWQRNYYEHIIRNENELNRIRQYIIDNPFKWDIDENNPVNIPKLTFHALPHKQN
jgi:putative transposase